MIAFQIHQSLLRDFSLWPGQHKLPYNDQHLAGISLNSAYNIL